MATFKERTEMAEAALRDVFPATPLQKNEFLSKRYDANIYLKREDLSPVRSYKLRGAFNAMRKQSDKKLFVCASAGNHAQGVAFVCRQMEKKGVIFMPVTTPLQKIEKTKSFGGTFIEVVLTGDFFDETLMAAQKYCANHDGHFLSPFDDVDVIEGQGTVACEVFTDPQVEPDILVVPVGGGGLSASLQAFVSENNPTVKIIFVEPKGGASLAAALEAGQPVALAEVDNFVDGASVAKIGHHTFEILQHVDSKDVHSVAEDRICTTLIEMLNLEGIVLEPAGALAVDVLKDLAHDIKGKTVVCITSGGNFDFERLPDVKERAQRFMGLKKYFMLRLPQRPGALKDFLGFLGPNDDISRFEYLKKSARNFGTVLLGIETNDPKNFAVLLNKAEGAGMAMRDVTEDEALVDLII